MMCMSAEEKILKKFETNNFSNQLINNLSLLKDNFTCNYFNENSFHKLINHHNAKSLKIFHINIRSINKHKIILKSYLESLKCTFDIIFLTETGNTTLFEIEDTFQNYKFYLDPPIAKRGSKGGAGILVNQNSFDSIEELFDNDEDNLKKNCQRGNCIVENKWLKLTNNKNTYITASIYRHPSGNNESFVNSLSKQLEKIDNTSTCIIAGDINIDFLKTENVNVNRYMDLLLESNFIPCINIPTRLTDTSATIIDHINIRLPARKVSHKLSAGNLISDITDHLPNFVILDEEINYKKDRPWIRLYNKRNIKNFNDNIHLEPALLPLPMSNDVNIVITEFSYNLDRVLNKYFPLTKMSRKKAKEKPFINNEIKKMISKRNKLYNEHITDRSNKVKENKWKKIRNQTNDTIRNAEIKYYKDQITKHGNNCQSMWKTLGGILNQKKGKTLDISSIISNNRMINDKKEIAKHMNNFFCSIGENLANQHTNANEDEHEHFLNAPMQQSMYMFKVSNKEVRNQINDLDSKKTSGHDGFTAKFLKLSQPLIEKPLTDIFNLSISTGKYPQNLKIAKCIPIYKKGKKMTQITIDPLVSLLALIKYMRNCCIKDSTST